MPELSQEELQALDTELAVGMGWKIEDDWWGEYLPQMEDSFVVPRFSLIIHTTHWHPTTDIAQAFEVVDRLIGKGWDFSVSIRQGSLWYVLFEQYPALAPHIGTWHEKCVLAICLAAREVMRI